MEKGTVMKRILCFGDSNTWGWDPATCERYPEEVRWTGVLQEGLGRDYIIIEEGLNGRTTVWEDPVSGGKNGYAHLPVCLESHRPLDLVILMLGTNDLKNRFSVTARDIARSICRLLVLMEKTPEAFRTKKPEILLLSPPVVGRLTDYAESFIGAVEKSREFAAEYNRVTEEHGCHFLDTAEYIVSSPHDGIHLEKTEHLKLGEALSRKVKEIL